MKKAFIVCFTVLLWLMGAAAAQELSQRIQAENSVWVEGNYFEFEYPLDAGLQKIVLILYGGNNLSVRYEGSTYNGELQLVDGRAVISRGLDIEDQYMIDFLDLPALFYQLAVSLLDVAAPEGLQTIETQGNIRVEEKEHPLAMGTMSASMGVPAPWILTGMLMSGTEGYIDYDFVVHTSQGEVALKGVWANQYPAPQIDDKMSLEGWKVHMLGSRMFREGNSTIMDYGTTPSSHEAGTFGELRLFLQEELKK